VVGDTLELAEETGKVKEISLRATMISTTTGADILIPNSNLLSENLKNWTISNKSQQLEVPVMTGTQADPEKVMELVRQCLDGLPLIDRSKSEVFLTKMDEKGFLFTIQVQIHDLGADMKIRSELLTSVYQKFGQHSIPLPVWEKFSTE